MTLEQIHKEKKQMQESMDLYYKRLHELDVLEKKAVQEEIKNNTSMLSENVWDLKFNDRNSKFYLYDNNPREGFKKLRSLIETDYHMAFTLFDKVTIIFNDGKMEMTAPTNHKLFDFIKEYNLRLNNRVTEKITKLDADIKDLEIAKKNLLDLLSDI